MNNKLPNGVMFNAYPDSIGKKLSDTVDLFKRQEFQDVFSLFYILPTFFNSDLDRGFSIIDYDMNADLVCQEDLNELERLGIALKFDMVLNHLSVGSTQFKDLLEKGEQSEFKEFFIDWNEFWRNEGERDKEGIIIPKEEHLERLFMRKPGLPILKIKFPDDTYKFYWNTFYQKVSGTGDDISYLGQMDLNAKSEKVWQFYEETIEKLANYGTKILRLDAFAYLHKEIGFSNFFNRPGTWEYLDRVKKIADDYNLIVLPEIHSEYGSRLHEELSQRDFPIYDFFFPGLVLHALDSGTNVYLLRWIHEILNQDLKTVNMLGCHDGIPVIDLKGSSHNEEEYPGLIDNSTIEELIERLLERGGIVKNLYGPDGKKVSYYQVNATFFSALGEDENQLRLARAIQLFMPGTPQIWYLDLFAGTNDYEAVEKSGPGGHRDINRTNLTISEVELGLQRQVVKDQLEMIRLRNTAKAFDGELVLHGSEEHELRMSWLHGQSEVTLKADLKSSIFTISQKIGDQQSSNSYNQ